MDRLTKLLTRLTQGSSIHKATKTQYRIHRLFLIIMYSRKLYLEDRNNSKQATTKSTTNKELDYTFGVWLCSNGEVNFFLKVNQDLQDLLPFHAMARIRSPSSRKMVGSLREKPTRTYRENPKRETRI